MAAHNVVLFACPQFTVGLAHKDLSLSKKVGFLPFLVPSQGIAQFCPVAMEDLVVGDRNIYSAGSE
jgi:hypothetical protein